jgi:thiol-disulfide isomerase/thioredoxin
LGYAANTNKSGFPPSLPPRSFKGYAAFGRVMADASEEGQALLREYNVMEVPTFLFFKNGREVDRHVGSSRGDLIGKILEVRGARGRPRRSRRAERGGADWWHATRGARCLARRHGSVAGT